MSPRRAPAAPAHNAPAHPTGRATPFALVPGRTTDVAALARTGVAPRTGTSRVDYAYAVQAPRRTTAWHPAERVALALLLAFLAAINWGLLP